MRTFLAAAMALSMFTAAVAAPVVAPTPVGKWNGKINVIFPKMPDNVPAEQKAMMTKILDGVKKMVIKLNIKKGNAYDIEASESPQNPTKLTKKSGKWSLKGKTVTLVDEKGKPQEFILGADGKTLTADMQKAGQGGAKIVFTRL